MDVITSAIFRDCRLRGVGVVRGISLPSLIDLTRRPYNTGHTIVWSMVLHCGVNWQRQRSDSLRLICQVSPAYWCLRDDTLQQPSSPRPSACTRELSMFLASSRVNVVGLYLGLRRISTLQPSKSPQQTGKIFISSAAPPPTFIPLIPHARVYAGSQQTRFLYKHGQSPYEHEHVQPRSENADGLM